MGIVTSFQDILDNVFIPLFEVTVNPGSHPQLHMFLKQVRSLANTHCWSVLMLLNYTLSFLNVLDS